MPLKNVGLRLRFTFLDGVHIHYHPDLNRNPTLNQTGFDYMDGNKLKASTSFEKRIRRHIIGRSLNFFAVTAPGFEHLCHEELMALPLSVKSAAIVPGGVEFTGRVHDCYLANLYLRTASRILMRIHRFKATNLRQLHKKSAGFPWELYIHNGMVPQIRVTTRHSRLFHTDAIADAFMENITHRMSGGVFAGHEDAQAFEQKIFVRVFKDDFTISLDSSGELLHKRGVKRHGGKAPIRETIAAAALRLAGHKGMEPLVDPMCGSGTFTVEGAMKANNIPSGWYREFAFMGWPCFRQKRWDHIKKMAQKEIAIIEHPLIFASDKDQKTVSAFKKQLNRFSFSKSVKVFHKDFFDLSPAGFAEFGEFKHQGMVAINPPYGLRLGKHQESKRLFQDICRKLVLDFKGWKLILIVPHKSFLKNTPFRFKTTPFFHGGLNLDLLTGKIL